MTIYLKDEATSVAVRKLAKLRGTTLTEAVRSAVNEVLAKGTEEKRRLKIRDTIRRIQLEVQKRSKPGGLPADKAFFDDLSGDI